MMMVYQCNLTINLVINQFISGEQLFLALQPIIYYIIQILLTILFDNLNEFLNYF